MKRMSFLLLLPLVLAGCESSGKGNLGDAWQDQTPPPNPCASACAEGVPCDAEGLSEGEVCGEGECGSVLRCSAGECVPAGAVCDDSNPCTDDSCVPGTGCAHAVRNGGELPCGVGECQVVVVQCVNGKLQECRPKEPSGEVCDGLDNDCDESVDEELPDRTCGNGVCMVTTPGCIGGKVPECVPNPAAATTESCNGKDDDCNGTVDDPNTPGCSAYLPDHDEDGYSATSVDYRCLCNPVAPYTAIQGGDCDDANGAVHTGADERCNGQDDNCNGATDEPVALDCTPHYQDEDADGYGAPGTDACLCGPDAEHPVAVAGDCNDQDEDIHDDATEICDGKDNECDGATDEEGSEGCTRYYVDADKDGYGVTSDSDFHCLCKGQELIPSYTASKGGDCCDQDANAHPNQTTAFSIRSQCNSFDFDCNGVASKKDTDSGSCDMELVTCNVYRAGWAGGTPACGETGDWLVDCTYNFGVCDKTTTRRDQKCL